MNKALLAQAGSAKATAIALRQPLNLSFARAVEGVLIGSIFGKEPDRQDLRDAISEQIKQLRDELVGPSPSTVEVLLAERIAISWLHVMHAEMIAGEEDIDNDFIQKWLNRTSARYVSALESLAKVQRLLRVPMVQVNIAEQQIVTNKRVRPRRA